MKITFLLTWADEMGGTELATYTLAANLVAHHEVEVLSVFKTKEHRFFDVDERVPVRYLIDRTVTPERPVGGDYLSPEERAGLAELPSELIDAGWEGAFDRMSDVELRAALAAIDTDVVITTSPALMSMAVTYAPPRVITIHQEHRPSQLRGPTGEPLLIYGPRLDALVVLTDRTRDWFAESFGDHAPKLATIVNAGPAEDVPRSPLDSRTVVMARRLVPDKQVDHAVHAFAQLREEFPDWRLRIFGDGKQKRNIQRLIDQLELHDTVELLGETRHMADEWAKSSICLLSSRDGEAFPLVLLEASAAGVPSVAYDISTGPAEIIRHEVDGLLVPAGHVDGLALALGRLMRDEETLRRYGDAAREGLERFSPQKVTRQWLELLAELAEQAASPQREVVKRQRAARHAASGGRRFNTAVAAERLTPSPRKQRVRERKLLAKDPGLVMSGGRLAERRDDMQAYQAGVRNLELVADALEAADIAYSLVRDGGTHHRIAVDAADRGRVYTALATACAGEPVYAELIAPRTDQPGAVLAESLETLGEVAALRVFRPVVSRGKTLRLGPAYGCDLEFWGADEEGRYQAPTRPTSVGATLPSITADSEYVQFGRSYPTTAVFTRDLASDVTFPVDVVYTWVDDADPGWRAARAAAGRADAAEGADDTEARYRDRDELRYSLRSLASFAPWVRHIYIVTAGQRPSWFNDAEGVTFVDHTEIFDDPRSLPTFNSHAIEAQLHNIPGLSKHFLYLNDDVFLGRPLSPGKFFQSNGTTRFFQTPTQIPLAEAERPEDAYFAAGQNNRVLIERKFGRTITHGFAHAPHPVRKDVLQEIATTYADEVARTAASRFRNHTDISIPSSLHHHYGFFNGTAAPGSIRCQYVNIGDYEHHPLLTRLLSIRGFDVFCLADAEDSEVTPDEQERIITTFLKAYFPVPSPWEVRLRSTLDKHPLNQGHPRAMNRPSQPAQRQPLPLLLSRRNLLMAGGATLGVAGVSAAVWQLASGTESVDDTGQLRSPQVQIVAHPDDDLFFNNTDLMNAIERDVGQVTICLTCGEGDGFNGKKARESGDKPDYEGYTAARYTGLRSAYAFMATGDADAAWTRSRLRLRGGQVVEVCTLKKRPEVKLVLFNLWVDSTKVTGDKYGRLYHLWQERAKELSTMVVPGSPVTESYTYTRADIITSLRDLIEAIRPTVVRTMDPDPDFQVHDKKQKQYSDQTDYSDSYDHTPTALFTWQAYREWVELGAGAQTVATAFRGYYNRRWPANLSKKAVAKKAEPINVYAWNDNRPCGDDGTCGDLNVPGIDASGGYGYSTIVRHPERTDWLGRGRGKALFAVATVGGRVVMWNESKPGSGDWSAAAPVSDHFVFPQPDLTRQADGLWRVTAVRPTFAAGDHEREVVTATIPGDFDALLWDELGNPDSGDDDPQAVRGLGQPVAVRVGDTRTMVVARDFDRSISYRYRDGADADWGKWKSVSGPLIQDGLAAITGADDSVHVFGAGKKGIVHWYYADGSWSHNTLSDFVPAAPPTVARLVDDRILLACREAKTAEVAVYVLSETGQYAGDGAKLLDGRSGTGSVAILPWTNETVGATLAVRTDSGRVSLTEWKVGSGDDAKWSKEDGPVCAGLPALAFDADDRAVCAALGEDGKLHIARQGDEGTGLITNWTGIG